MRTPAFKTTFYDPSRGKGWIVIREEGRWCGHLASAILDSAELPARQVQEPAARRRREDQTVDPLDREEQDEAATPGGWDGLVAAGPELEQEAASGPCNSPVIAAMLQDRARPTPLRIMPTDQPCEAGWSIRWGLSKAPSPHDRTARSRMVLSSPLLRSS